MYSNYKANKCVIVSPSLFVFLLSQKALFSVPQVLVGRLELSVIQEKIHLLIHNMFSLALLIISTVNTMLFTR